MRLQFADVMDFNLQNFKGLEWQGGIQLIPKMQYHKGGGITVTGTALPGIKLATLHCDLAESIYIEDKTNTPDINICFQLGGYMHTRFRGLGHELEMRAGRHNLVYTPEAGEHHHMDAEMPLDILHLSMSVDHFLNLIGTESRWAENALAALEQQRPFSGMPGICEITPVMQGLLAGIRRPPTGPMRQLLLQARVTELLAHQFEQFISVKAAPQPSFLSADEITRLHALRGHLDVHFLEDHSLTTLARRALLNEFKLKKGFREIFGTTVFGYLKDLRMSHADRLLRDHKLMVEEVADQLGYEHPHHFSAAFRKHFGRRPSGR